MVTTLYIVRHCQSTGNITGRFQGRFDASVSEDGEKQLELLALRFRNIKLDAIYSSPLQRAYRTAQAAGRFHQLPIHTCEDLAEMNVGEMENLRFSEVASLYPDIARTWDETPDQCGFPGGETMTEVYARVNAAIDRIAAENIGKTVLVATHGGVIKNINARVVWGSIKGLREDSVFGNTSVSILEVEDDGSVKWKMVNDTSHLPEGMEAVPIPFNLTTEVV